MPFLSGFLMIETGTLLLPIDSSISLVIWSSGLSRTRQIWSTDPGSNLSRTRPTLPASRKTGMIATLLMAHSTFSFPPVTHQGLLVVSCTRRPERGFLHRPHCLVCLLSQHILPL